MSFRFLVFAAASAVGLAASPASAAFTIDFAEHLGDSNPLAIATTDHNVVTFGSPSGAGVFTVTRTTGLFSGFAVGLGDPASFSGDTLTISFAKPIAGGMEFAFG